MNMKQFNKEEQTILRNLSFKTISYHRNFDFMFAGGNIINEYDGKVSKLRILERNAPLTIGEYIITSWNLKLGRDLNIDIYNILNTHKNEAIYGEFIDLINKKQISIEKYNKIIFIRSFILKKEYRKKHITEEFIEFIYSEFYGEKTLIVVLALPIQYDEVIMDSIIYNNFIEMREKSSNINIEKINSNEYYGMNELISKTDHELNEIKLFLVAQKCGFERIGESHIFKFNPQKTLERLKVKWNVFENI